MRVFSAVFALFSAVPQLRKPLRQGLVQSNLKTVLPPQISEIVDSFACDQLSNLRAAPIKVDSSISDKPIVSSYSFHQCKKAFGKASAVVLLHGFDSNCLEFRRLVNELTSDSDVYVPDILGWGFSDCSSVQDFSPDAKLQHLKAFIQQVVRQPCILAGASLGGGVAINLAVEICPELVKKLVLIDAQGFVDGQGKSNLPMFLAKIGIAVLKARWLRKIATKLSYVNKEFFATDQALKIGSVHCFLDTWDRASINFLLSGGFVTSPKVPLIKQPTLVIFGEKDEVIDISNAYKFESMIPNVQLKIIPECGHVPHIEKAPETAVLIKKFCR